MVSKNKIYITKMPTYTIIRSENTKQMCDEVNKYIMLGYLPMGGISYDGICYIQAMLKS